MKNKRLLIFSSILIAGILLTACGGTTTATQAIPTSGSTSTQATAAPTMELVLDPANSTNTEAVSSLYVGLVSVKDGNVTGALAESHTVSADGLDYIFNLRSGLTFHDGTPVNADAVVANFNRWFDKADPLHGSAEFAAWTSAFKGFKGDAGADGKPVSQYDGIEKVNELTVLVHLNTPDPDFLKKIADPAFSIVSPAVLKAGKGDGGAGPYKFASGTDTTLSLEPFTGYWDAASVPSQKKDVPAK